MTPHKCPDCGCFLGNVVAAINHWNDRMCVMGWCSHCGMWQEPSNWDAEDFIMRFYAPLQDKDNRQLNMSLG